MSLFDRLPVGVVEMILQRLRVTSLADLRACSRTVGAVSPESLIKRLRIPLDVVVFIVTLRPGRLNLLSSVDRLELVGSGSIHSRARQFGFEQHYRDNHQLAVVVLLLSRHVTSMTRLVSLELTDVSDQTVLAGAGCLATSCPTLSTLKLRSIILSIGGSFDMLCMLLGELPGLHTFELRECALPLVSEFKHLRQLRNLRIIDLTTPMVFTDPHVQVWLKLLPALVQVCC